MKRVGDLWSTVVSDDNLSEAIDEVNRTHRWHRKHRPNRCTIWVEQTKAERIKDLRRILEQGFVQSKPRHIRRYDASAQKWRDIHEPRQWPDQYIHHALIQAIQPVLMCAMDPYCCGSIRKRGADLCRKSIKKWVGKGDKRTKYCFQCDIYHFYDSLTPEVVMYRMRQLIKDHRVLNLIEATVKDGIFIGAYTSQWYANTILQPLDHILRRTTSPGSERTNASCAAPSNERTNGLPNSDFGSRATGKCSKSENQFPAKSGTVTGGCRLRLGSDTTGTMSFRASET